MCSEKYSTVVLISNYGMGNGPEELSLQLLETHLSLLDLNDSSPDALFLFTEGVKLAIEGSPVLDILKELQLKGVHIMLCLTCLNYYKLNDKVKVGTTGTMKDLVTAVLDADKVISI